MTLGELYDKLAELKEAEAQVVVDAEQSIRYGGNEITMKGKYEILEYRARCVETLRDESV